MSGTDETTPQNRSGTKIILKAICGLLAIYLAVAAVVGLRKFWFGSPSLAASDYLQALKERNTAVIYLYSDMLGPRLLDMMSKSDMTDEERKQLWAKDYARWKTEFRKGAKALDSLRRERKLFVPNVRFQREEPASYKAEIWEGNQSSLVSYSDQPGTVYHFYYRLRYPSAARAPAVSVLDNLRTGLKRKIKSVIVRVQVRRRADVSSVPALLMEWDWLDKLAFLFPFLAWLPQQDSSEMWMVGVSFDVDKLTLETF